MNRIEAKFAELARRREAALIPYVTAGDPDPETTLDILRALEENGADCVELGFPFSDPMADGPTIQRASERALKSGMTMLRLFALVRELRRKSELPIVLFGYYNPFFHFGLRAFCREAKKAGVDGVLCVDLPPEESGELERWARREGLDVIFLLAPTSDPERIKLVARHGRGFLYYVSLTGVTGARERLEEQLPAEVARVRRATRLPVGVGFGVSRPEHAAWIATFADAVVVGSALIEIMEKEKRNEDKVKEAASFVSRMKRAVREAATNNRKR